MLLWVGYGYAQTQTATPYIYSFSFNAFSLSNPQTGNTANPTSAVVSGIDFSSSPVTKIVFTFSDGTVSTGTTSFIDLTGGDVDTPGPNGDLLVTSVPAAPAAATSVTVQACNYTSKGASVCSSSYGYSVYALTRPTVALTASPNPAESTDNLSLSAIFYPALRGNQSVAGIVSGIAAFTNNATGALLGRAKLALNNALTTFVASTGPVLPDNTSAVKPFLADFNQDGVPDVLLLDADNSVFHLLFGTIPRGTTVESLTIDPGGCAYVSAAVGDFNGDGYPDIVYECPDPTGAAGNNLYVALNEHGAEFASTLIGNVAGETQIAVGDFNKDGKQDVVVSGALCAGSCSFLSYGFTVFPGNGAGFFSAGVTTTAADAAGTQLQVADFNQDGYADVAVYLYTRAGGEHIYVHQNLADGSSTFNATPVAVTAPTFNTTYKIGTLSGNYPSLLLIDPNDEQIGVALNSGSSTTAFAAPVYTSVSGVETAVFGDLNGDGLLDAAVYNGSTIEAYLGNGSAGFTLGFPVGNTVGPSLTSAVLLAAADQNGDGLADVMAFTPGSDSNPQVLNYITSGPTSATLNAGSFSPQTVQLATTSPGTRTIASGQGTTTDQVGAAYTIENVSPSAIPAGANGATLTLAGALPSFSSTTFGVCFYSIYGGGQALFPTSANGVATLTVPASYIQAVPPNDSGLQENGYFPFQLYVVKAGQSCDGSTGIQSNEYEVDLVLPSIANFFSYGFTLANPKVSATANPKFLEVFGEGFGTSPATTIKFTYGPGTLPAATGTTMVLSGSEIYTTIPTPPAGATEVYLQACNAGYCGQSLSTSALALTATSGTLTAAPNPVLSTETTNLTAKFGPATASIGGVVTGLATFASDGSTAGTAPLVLDPTTAGFAVSDTSTVPYMYGEARGLGPKQLAQPGQAAAIQKVLAVRKKLHPQDEPNGFQNDLVSHIVDFNQDGIPDVFELDEDNTHFTLLLGTNPRGDFIAAGDIRPNDGCGGYLDAAVADLNGDGYPDVAYICENYNQATQTFSEQLFYALNNKQGALENPVLLGSTFAYQVAIADGDGDGRQDIVTAGYLDSSSTTAGFTTYLQKTAGTFSAGPVTTSVLGTQGVFQALDLNGDGFADIAVTNLNASNFQIGLILLQNDKTGAFTAKTTSVPTSNGSTFSVGTDGTTGPSFLIVDTESNRVGVALNHSSGGTLNILPTTYYSVPNLQSAVFGKFASTTGLGIATFDGTNVAVLQGKGQDSSGQDSFLPAFTSAASLQPSLSGGTLMASTDLNGDGYADLIVFTPPYSGSGGTLTSYLVSGTSTASLSAGPFPAGSHSLTASTPGTILLLGSTATTSLTVSAPATPTLTWATPAAIPYGTALSSSQLNAVATGANGVILPGTFAYTPASGTVLGAGTQALKVVFTPTDATDYVAATRTISLVVNKATPVVTWVMPASITTGTPLSSTQLDATAVGVTGAALPGTFAYTPAAGTVLGAGTQTLSVLFTPTDATDYTTAPQTTTIGVGKATPNLTWATPAAIPYGTALSATQLDAVALDPTGAVLPGTFAYTPASGTVLGAGTQALKVVFTPTDATDYVAATKTISLVVNKATPVVTWVMPASITTGTPLSSTQLDATAVGVTGAALPGTFAYTPAAGTVLGAGTQTLSVLFTPTDTTDYTTAPQTTTIGVGKATPNLTWATPAAIPYGTALSATQLDAVALDPTGAVLPGTFAYTPASGTVLGAGTQALKVVFTPTDATDYVAATRTISLVVNKATPVVTWVMPASITTGTPLSATQLDATAVGVTGAALPGTFAYTPAAGTVLGAGTQTLSVVFTPTDTTDYTTAPQTTTIGVGKATPNLTWATPAAINYGTALSSTQLDAVALDPTGAMLPGTFAYTPASGTVLGAGTQALKVVFTPTDATDYVAATRTISLVVNKATPVVTWVMPASITTGTPLSSTQLDATAVGVTGAALPGTFAYTPAAGTVLGAGTQTLSVLFTPTDTTDYTTAPQTTTIGVGKATPNLTWATPAAINYGTALSSTQLDAVALDPTGAVLPGTFAYTPASGTVLGAGTQALKVVFTPTDATDYVAATKTISLVVNKATPVVTWVMPASITTGTPLSSTQLDATAVGVTGAALPGTFAYTPAAGTVLGAGTQTLSVLFTPTDATDYTTAPQTTTIGVGKATPNLTWATPAAIKYGTALSSTQLDAVALDPTGAMLPGTFAYTPASGTVLGAGTQALKVVFTPTDATDYVAATKTISLVVNKATPVVTWVMPASITTGTPLSSTQLDATAVGVTGAALPGTFAYTPAAGTVLGAGTQTLSVLFTPTDTTDYTTAPQTTTIGVGKATPNLTWATPAAIPYGTALSATQLDAVALDPTGAMLPGTFAYTPASGTVLGAGTQALKVVFTPTDATDYVAATRTISLVVNKATPVVTWVMPASITTGTPLSSTQLDATAVGVTGAALPGTFAYTPAAGTVLGAGTQTLSVLFTPTDATDYTTAPQTTTIGVGKATPNLTWATPAAIPYGTALSATQLDAVALDPTGAVLPGTFAYTPASGTVLGAGTQALKVVFTPTDATDYVAATKTISLVVNKATPVVTWVMPASITTGTPLSATQLDATAVGVTGAALPGTFAYTPAAGTVLGAGTQTLSVLFTPTDATDYTTAPQTTTIGVGKATPNLTWATPAAIPYGTALSGTQLDAVALDPTGAVLPGTFAYTPASGTVLGAGTQALKVVFTPTDATDYVAATRTISLVVNKATPVVTWVMPASITTGTPLSSTQLDATAVGVTGAALPGTFAYTPAAGTVLGAGTQTLSVLFTPTDTTDYTTAPQTTTIGVGKATPNLTWATPAAIPYGTALSGTQLDAVALDPTGAMLPGTFAYTPASGTVLGAGTQALKVVFTPTDATDYVAATRTISLVVNKATPVVTWVMPASITTGTPLSSTQLDATAVGVTGAALPGTFAYTPAAGTVLGAGTQTLSVLFTPTDATDYTTAPQTTTIGVGKATPNLTWATPAAIPYGTALSATQLDAVALDPTGAVLPGTFAYTPALGTVLGAGTQALKVVFTPTDATDYVAATKTISLVVNKATPVVTWVMPASITTGTPLSATQLDATAVGVTGAALPGTFAYTPAAGTVLGAGTQTLSVVFTPTDATDYTTAPQTTTIGVGKATPNLTWATPAAIPYGTALSGTQLDAVALDPTGAVLPGTFAYTPASGTVLGAGTQALKVVFTPTDATDYVAATKTISLVVNKATPVVTWVMPASITTGTPLSSTQLDATAVGVTGAALPGTFAYTPAAGTVLGAGTQTLSVLFTPTDATDYTTAPQTTTIGVGKATPNLTWATPAAIPYGTALSGTQLDAVALDPTGAVLPGTFAYTPASGTVLGAGTQALKVVFTPTDATDYVAATKTISLVVNKATPVVTWVMPASITTGTPLSSTQLDATAVGVTGAALPGTFAYTPAAGTVLGAGTQTLSVVFTPTDTTDYTTAPQTTTIGVGKATPNLTWATPAAINYGTALSSTQLDAVALDPTGAVLPGTFAYTPASGTVLGAGTQALKVVFTPTDATDYVAAAKTISLVVNKATPVVTWVMPASITTGTPLSSTQLDATAVGVTGAALPGTFAYTPAAGTVLGAGTQTLSVLFTPTDATDYTTAPQTTTIGVGKATPNLTWATPAAIPYGTALSATQLDAVALDPTGAMLPGTFAYTPALGTVLGAGTQALKVVFTPTDATDYVAATKTISLVVNKATPVVTWVMPASITTGTPLSSTQLDATAVGVTGAALPGTFAYTPAAGTVLGAGTQTLSVLFTPTDATDYTTAPQTTTIGVGKATPNLTWATPAAIPYGTALSGTQLDAVALDPTGAVLPGTFAYTPALGTVLGAGTQALKVVFTPTDATDYVAATKTISLVVNKATPVVTWVMPASITTGTPLSSTQLDATAVGVTGAALPGTFAYTPAAGTVLGAGTQTLSVLFTPTDATDYTTAPQTTTIGVGKATPNLTWATPAAIPYGTALSGTQLDAVALDPTGAVLPGTFAYTPALGTVLGAGTQALKVVFTPTDATDYVAATKTISLVVNKATPVVTWVMPASITTGTPLSATQLDATAVGVTGAALPGTFAYTPAAGTVLGAGTQTLSVLFTPTDATDYTTAPQTTTIGVGKATPNLTWATPAAIPYGTALSGTQLDAVALDPTGAVLPGTFAYTPASGTVLGAGTQALKVVFTPTDATDYVAATRTISLVVNKATPVVTWVMPASITTGTPLSSTQLDATAVGVTGAALPGTFAYTPAAGTVLGAGTQTLSVLFTPTDATDYTTAPQTTTIGVGKATPNLTWATPAAIPYGTALSATQLDAVALDPTGAVLPGTFAYTPALGTVLGAGTQALKVVFTPTDATDYVAATKTISLVVNKATPVVTWVMPASITTGTPLSSTQLDATAVGVTGAALPGTFAYTPAAGTVLGAGTQTLSVLFTPTDATDYTTAPQTTTIGVGKATPNLTWATPAAIPYGTALSATQLDAVALDPTGAMLPGTFAYTPAIGVSPGAGTQTLTTTFTPSDQTNYTIATKTVSLTVNKATPVANWPMPAPITQGTALSALQLDAAITGTQGTLLPGTVAYTPAAGTILGVGTQTLSVLFTPADATDYKSLTATTTVVVGRATPLINWATPASIPYGTTLTATQLDAAASGVSGVSLPGTFSYLPAAGTVLNAGMQTLSVTFTPTDTTDYAPTTKSIVLSVTKVAPVLTWPPPAPVTQGTPLSATQLDATAAGINGINLPGTFSYTPATGTVPSLGTQALSVTFTPTDALNYTTATKTNQLQVSIPATTTRLTSSAATPQYGQTITLSATLAAGGTNTVTAPTGNIIFRDGTSLIGIAPLTASTATLTLSTLTAGSHSISAMYAGDANYAASTSAVLTQTIAQAVPQVAWTPVTATVVYGTALSAAQLNASVTTPYSSAVAGTFAYTPALGTVLGAGTQTLGVVFTPADTTNYKAANGTVSLIVQKAKPQLTWPTPDGVVSGTALTAAQLNATSAGVTGSALPGTFTYTPAAGTLVRSGTQTLSVIFTPADLADYTAATATVQLTATNLTLTQLSTSSALLGDPAKTITLTGTGFLPSSVVQVNGATVPSTYASGTSMTAVIPASDFTTVQTLSVVVMDPGQSQTSAAQTISVIPPPVPITFTAPTTAAPAAQPVATLKLVNPYPAALTGMVKLSFTPANGGADDPAIQFAGGGRTMTFMIPAQSTLTPTIAFQDGTVAGTIDLTLHLEAGGVDVTPTTLQPVAIALPASVPGITSATFTQDGSTVTVTLAGYSNTVEVQQAIFHFTAVDGAGLLRNPDITVNVNPIFTPYFSSGSTAQYGSAFTYMQTFTLTDSTKIGQVSATLSNSVGVSPAGTTP